MYYRNWHTWLWRLRAPRSAIYDMENQGGQWYSLVWVWRLENQERRYPRAEDGRPNSGRESKFPFLYLQVLFRPSRDWTTPTHTREGDLSFSAYRFKCYFISRKSSHTQDNVLPDIWASLNPGKWTHKINHHSIDVFIIFNMRTLAEEDGFTLRKQAYLNSEVPVYPFPTGCLDSSEKPNLSGRWQVIWGGGRGRKLEDFKVC